MELKEYIEKGGQKLRLGYTTGSCAAAAAKAAAAMLLTGQKVNQVRLKTPKGLDLILDIEDIQFREKTPETASNHMTGNSSGNMTGDCSGYSADRRNCANKGTWENEGRILPDEFPEAVSCAVRKDSGDDPDITNHTLIYATVARSDRPGIRIDGGVGVGRVTKPGLDQPVGNAAINSTPRRMIREAVLEVLQSVGAGPQADSTEKTETLESCKAGRDIPEPRGGKGARHRRPTALESTVARPEKPETQKSREPGHENPEIRTDREIPPGFDITISVPQGRALAAKTFNPRLGIEGGISILGTSGIVEPMSDQALLDTIRVEIRVRREEGLTILPAAPGNYGRNFFLEKYGFSLDTAVTSSNFIYDTVRMAAEAGFGHMLFVGHIGKLVKVAGGIRNTHSQYGDHRMEILTEIAESLFDKDSRGSGRESGQRVEKLRCALADCVTTDEAVRILQEYGIAEAVLTEMTRRIQAVMQDWAQGRMRVEVVVFSNVHGELGRTEHVLEYMRILQEEIAGN